MLINSGITKVWNDCMGTDPTNHVPNQSYLLDNQCITTHMKMCNIAIVYTAESQC